MTELVVMADVEQVLIDYLAAVLPAAGFPGVPVATRLSGPLPVESVILFRTGGLEAGTIRTDKPLVIVECRAGSESRAAALALTTRGLLHAADGLVLSGHQIYSVAEISGPGNLPDPITLQARYTETFQIHLAGTVLAR